jgi:hypothetical protein
MRVLVVIIDEIVICAALGQRQVAACEADLGHAHLAKALGNALWGVLSTLRGQAGTHDYSSFLTVGVDLV